MTNPTIGVCLNHIWERHLEVHNKLERVVRVCAHCGREEICWSQPLPRRLGNPMRARQIRVNVPVPPIC